MSPPALKIPDSALQSSPRPIERLNLRCRGLTHLMQLRPWWGAHLRVLCLSHNALADLRGLAQCSHLTELYAAYNQLRHLPVLNELIQLRRLRILAVQGNPWRNASGEDPAPHPGGEERTAGLPWYATWIQACLPQVRRLNGKDLTRPRIILPPELDAPPAQDVLATEPAGVSRQTIIATTSHRETVTTVHRTVETVVNYAAESAQRAAAADAHLPPTGRSMEPFQVDPDQAPKTIGHPLVERTNVLMAISALTRDLNPAELGVVRTIATRRLTAHEALQVRPSGPEPHPG